METNAAAAAARKPAAEKAADKAVGDKRAAPVEESAAVLERAVARVAVAQILRSERLGFTAARASALEALTGVMLRFLTETAHLSHEAAEQAGRAGPCLPDVLRALRTLGVDVSRLVKHVSECNQGERREVPFAQPLPPYPVRKRPKRVTPSFQEAGEQPKGTHLPKWAPALPDKHALEATAAHKPAPADDTRVRRELNAQTVQAEKMLAKVDEALHPGKPTDAMVAPRWGGPLDQSAYVHSQRLAEQRTALQLTSSDAVAGNPYARSAAVLDASAHSQVHGGAAGVGPSHHRGQALPAIASAAAVGSALVLPTGPEHGAGFSAGASGPASWVAVETPASQAVRDLVSVDTYSLESGLRARATARKVAGALAGKRKGTFAALPGRESDLVDDWEDDRLNAAAAKAKHDAVRVARMIARDPHDQSLLESAADLINQS